MNFRLVRLMGPLVLALIPGYLSAQAPPGAAAATTSGPGTVATTAAPPAAPAAMTAPTAAASATNTAAGAKPAPTAEEMQAVRKTASGLGLKPRKKGGTEVYCKSSADIGTRLETEHCYTKQDLVQLQKMQQINQSETADMQRSSLTTPQPIEPFNPSR